MVRRENLPLFDVDKEIRMVSVLRDILEEEFLANDYSR